MRYACVALNTRSNARYIYLTLPIWPLVCAHAGHLILLKTITNQCLPFIYTYIIFLYGLEIIIVYTIFDAFRWYRVFWFVVSACASLSKRVGNCIINDFFCVTTNSSGFFPHSANFSFFFLIFFLVVVVSFGILQGTFLPDEGTKCLQLEDL